MKGQSGVEYLTTYGWAIFILLIIIGIIVSSGVLTPNYLISEECNFGNNLKCNFYMVNDASGSTLNIELFNAFPYPIHIQSFELRNENTDQGFTGFDSGTDVDVLSGGSIILSGTQIGDSVSESAVSRFVGNITYYSCAPELGDECSDALHTISGRIVAKVTPSD
jgi:hypothetical protein